MTTAPTLVLEKKPAYRYVGKSIPRLDRGKVKGFATYAYDLEQPGMMYGKVKRSTLPHAKILRIDTSKAESIPGVVCVITAKDLPNSLYGVMLRDTPVLARDTVRYFGEPVAAVAARSPKIAKEATEQIEVEYEPLSPVFDPELAVKADAPVLHPQRQTYKTGPPFQVRIDAHPNVNNHYHVEIGDPDVQFSRADLTVENRFTTQPVQHMHLEPSASLAKYDPESGYVTVWTATQSPYMIRQQISQALEITLGKIRVISVYAGAGFGSRLEVQTETLGTALSMKAHGLPVKMSFTREEVFFTLMRHPFTIYIKDAVRKDGRIIGRIMRVLLNGGGYSGGFGISVGRNCIFGAVSTYNIPNFRFDSMRVYTNLPPSGAYRGYGSMQIEWATESQIDIIANKLGIDAVEVRKRNFLHEGDINAIGEKVRQINHHGVLGAVESRLNNAVPIPSNDVWILGKGMAITTKYTTAPTASAAMIRVLVDGTAILYSSAVEIGTGTETIFSQIVAEEFNCPIESVKIATPDTEITPFDDGANSSRRTYYMGNAIIVACHEVKKQIFENAARKLNTTPDDLELKDWTITSRKTGSSLKLEDLFVRDQTRSGAFFPTVGELIGRGVWHEEVGRLDPVTGRGSKDRVVTYYAPLATGVQLMVNKETGQIRLLNVTCAIDVGTAINPLSVEGQIIGGVAQGIGTALYEEMKFENGVLSNGDLAGYKVPSILDTPNIEAVILEQVKETNGPFGARGVGEGPVTGIAPAIANAVADAIGVRVFDLPITPDKISALLESAT